MTPPLLGALIRLLERSATCQGVNGERVHTQSGYIWSAQS